MLYETGADCKGVGEGTIITTRMSTRINAGEVERGDEAETGFTHTEKRGVAQPDRNFASAGRQRVSAAAKGPASLSSFPDWATLHPQGSGIHPRQNPTYSGESKRSETDYGRDALASDLKGAHRRLTDSIQLVAASLQFENEDIVERQRLAERLVRRPDDAPVPPRRLPQHEFRRYMAAAGLFVLFTGGAAAYLLQPGVVSKWAPEGVANASAIVPLTEDVLDSVDERTASAAMDFSVAPPADAASSEQAAQLAAAGPNRTDSDSWASAVETLRMLSAKPVATQQLKGPAGNSLAAKNDDSVLMQLQAWHNTAKPR